MRASTFVTGVMILGAGSLVALQPAAAVPMTANQASAFQQEHVQTVQYRHGWHGGRGWRHRGYGYGGGGAVLGGLAAGAIIGGAIASSQARAADATSYCAQRYRSYDPGSGTYLGSDGLRHPCR
jgi:hypothetical protein